MRRPQQNVVLGKPELSRGDADDRIWPPVDGNRPSDDIRTATETLSPPSVAEDHHLVAPLLCFRLQKEPAKCRRLPQQAEQSGRNGGPDFPFSLVTQQNAVVAPCV